METSKTLCWVCGSAQMNLYKKSDISAGVNSQSFAITDSNYGVTGELVKCSNCGFIQCTNLTDVLNFYENLEDQSYEATRQGRALQSAKMLSVIKKYAKGKKLMDIGAGSGILVEEAIKMGYEAVGVEPSKWLWQKAADRNLPVALGIFPHPNLPGPFDVITLIDVIEHVSDPVGLLRQATAALAKEGVIVVSTPDIGSILGRFLGKRWWHLRVAHIGYFNVNTLTIAAKNAGLKKVYQGRSKWYFAGDYFVDRVNMYLPKFLKLPKPSFLKKVIIPLNLGDSMFLIFKK